MQVRVNSGSVCRDDGRGIEVAQLIENMKRDRVAYERDEQTLRYHVTENVKVSLLAAANEYEEQNELVDSVCRQTSPLSFELGLAAMPTIQDNDEENQDEEDSTSGKKDSSSSSKPTVPAINLNPDDSEEVASYLINLQPSPNTPFHTFLYEQRRRLAEEMSFDPTYLYPLHVSVSGFFEATRRDILQLVDMMIEDLAKELSISARVKVGKVICTTSGYVLYLQRRLSTLG
jgi:hypothetical protein